MQLMHASVRPVRLSQRGNGDEFNFELQAGLMIAHACVLGYMSAAPTNPIDWPAELSRQRLCFASRVSGSACFNVYMSGVCQAII